MDTETEKQPSRRENKKLVRAAMIDAFGDQVETKDICTGTVTYTVIRPKGHDFNIAAIYGSKTPGGQSLWVKEAVWEMLAEADRDSANVVDVALFNRGWQWAIHTGNASDPLIEKTAQAALEWGNDEASRKEERQALKAERARKRAEREARMAEKRAAFRANRDAGSEK